MGTWGGRGYRYSVHYTEVQARQVLRVTTPPPRLSAASTSCRVAGLGLVPIAHVVYCFIASTL